MISRFKKSTSKTLLLATLSLIAISAAATGLANAQEKTQNKTQNTAAASSSFTDDQRAQIESIIRDYMIENPELIAEAMTALRFKQEQQMQEQALAKLTEHAAFFQSEDVGFVGNPDGDVTVVEFFDYNCGYCKKAFEDVQALLNKDKNVKIVFVEMPILGPTSITAAQWALAAKEQGKYFEFHKALMEHQGGKSEAELKVIAGNLGLDVEKMAKDAASDKTAGIIERSGEVARDIGIQGTPAFVVGKQLFRGYIGTDALIESVRKERG